MLLFVGWIIVSAALLGGFVFSGGNPGTLFVTGEYIIIIGIFLGYIVASSSGGGLENDDEVDHDRAQGLALYAEALYRIGPGDLPDPDPGP